MQIAVMPIAERGLRYAQKAKAVRRNRGELRVGFRAVPEAFG